MDPFGIGFCFLTYLFLFYAYFVLVGVIIVPLMNETVYGCLNGVALTILIILCIISHLRASLSNPGYVHESLCSSDQNPEKEGCTMCVKCGIYRPMDTHHCKICKKCIKKRHHHCPWINNCIGELNQKYFIQFVFYIGVLCIYSICFVMASLIMYPEESLSNNKLNPSSRVYHSVFVIVECLVFGIFVFAILCEQISSITSTLVTNSSVNSINSSSSSNQKSKLVKIMLQNLKLEFYNRYTQFRIVFGKKNPLFWLLPFDLHYYGKIAKPFSNYYNIV